MLPDLWGRCMWESMHYVAAGYPNKPTKQDQKRYCCYFKNLAYVLPCKSCSVSYKMYLKQVPIANFLSSRKRLLYWTFLIHNKVNKKLKKKVRIPWKIVCRKYLKVPYSRHKRGSVVCSKKNIDSK